MKEVFSNLLCHQDDLVEVLVNDSRPIQGCFNDVLDHLTPDLAIRASLLEATKARKEAVVAERTLLERVEAESSNASHELDRLRSRKDDLIMKLERTRAQIIEQEGVVVSLLTRVDA
ncbi:hypothetical protein GUJ93_ZPchr0010g10232 [Zizania palustris]|uniref:Uncharacterized protein n=1 Tax=Zizania palustris TaxID=103762 RepID=A0A8J5W7G8_ZIZPA|nr:hypothetical protein GUJ93_ZPchr0010g10232 [Zizania palustris]